MKTIMLNLCGQLQCYGYTDRDGNKRTRLKPTKSAIAGMIAGAGGISEASKIKEIKKSITIKVKNYEIPRFIGDLREKTGSVIIITDYVIPCGLPLNSPVVEEAYIADTYFRVWVSGDDEKIRQYALWLDAPDRYLYLGEESCMPSMPIFLMKENQHIFD